MRYECRIAAGGYDSVDLFCIWRENSSEHQSGIHSGNKKYIGNMACQGFQNQTNNYGYHGFLHLSPSRPWFMKKLLCALLASSVSSSKFQALHGSWRSKLVKKWQISRHLGKVSCFFWKAGRLVDYVLQKRQIFVEETYMITYIEFTYSQYTVFDNATYVYTCKKIFEHRYLHK